jgi:outer membrane protein OmpA-like peptidoglycan-associated protein
MIGVAACGSALPPRELINARAAYQKAQGGPAAEHAPAELDAAMQALRRAETTFDEDGDTEDTRDLAYIAECAAQKAEAKGGATKAARDLEETDKTYKKVQAEQLDTTRRALESVERARAYQEEEAKRAKAEAEKTKEALEKERKARLDAEKKLGGALASLEQMAKVKQEARGVVISLSGEVLFATGKSELLPIAQQKLEQVAQALKDQGYKRIVVEGHTDSRGARTQNMDLSLARAESVRMYLISRGIDANKISAVGLGPDRPVADNATPDGRANNRRVELIVTPE